MRRVDATLLLTGWLLIAAGAGASSYPQNPLPDGNTVYVSHEGVYRFDDAATDPAWRSLQDIQTFAPVIQGDLLLVGSTQGLYALRRDDGSIAWRIESSRTLFTPTLGARAYAGSLHGELYAIEAHDGSIAWRHQFDGWVYSPAIGEADGRLWTAGQQHALYTLDLEGKLLRELPVAQESVFGAVDIGDGRAAINLFDGSTAVVDFAGPGVDRTLAGVSQPTAIRRHGDRIYRSHSDGSLAAFAADSLHLQWQREIAEQNLVLHPSLTSLLLLGDGDRQLFLLDPARTDALCTLHSGSRWLLPAQLQPGQITFFRKSMQPPGLKLVQTPATCD